MMTDLAMKNLRIPLRIVFYRDGQDWIAHCLEFDLIGDGSTKESALDSLGTAIDLQVKESVEHANPSNLFSPADGKYFAMFAAGKNVVFGELHIHVDSVQIDKAEYREYDDSCADDPNLVCA